MKYILLDLNGVTFTPQNLRSDSLRLDILEELNADIGTRLDLKKCTLNDYLYCYNALTSSSYTATSFLEEIFQHFKFNDDLLSIDIPGIRICLVSDNYEENIEFMNSRFPLLNRAFKSFYSCQLGLLKSETLFFQKVLSELRCKASDCLLIDDCEENIFSASQLGIPGILFSDWPQTIYFMKTHFSRMKMKTYRNSRLFEKS